MLTILGWDVTEEPALLIGAERLVGKVSVLRTIYPDGFILVRDADRSVLLVDFDEPGVTYLDIVELPRVTT